MISNIKKSKSRGFGRGRSKKSIDTDRLESSGGRFLI
jgi:hypothetical protein